MSQKRPTSWASHKTWITPLERLETVTNESVYCDIQMTLEEAVEMVEVLKALREADRHPALQDKFRDMLSRQCPTARE